MKVTASIVATLILHAAVVAAAVVGLSTRTEKPKEPPVMAVQLVQEPVAEAPAPVAPPAAEVPPSSPPQPAPPPPQPAPLPPPPPEKKQQEPKRAPKPAVAPRKPAKPKPERIDTQAPAPVPDSAPSPPAPLTPAPPAAAPAPAPPVPPAPPVRTGVSIPASYAASNRKPAYPALSRRYGDEGTVVLRVLVKADGTAGEVQIRSSSGFPLLDESARSTVQTWRFNPATSDGKPVDEWFLVPIPFKLQN